jgi:DNA anti-recombination protein RmuC
VEERVNEEVQKRINKMVEDVPDDVTTSEEEEEEIIVKPKRTVIKQVKQKEKRSYKPAIVEPEGIKVNFF